MFNIVVSETDISAIKSLSYKDREHLKDAINSTEPSHILTPAKLSGFECPICGNGSGEDGTGVTPTLDNGVWLYGCRRGDCLFNGDLLKIIANVNNINKNTFEGFCELLAIGAKICRINYSNSNSFYDLHSTTSRENSKKLPKDYSKFLANTQANLESWLNSVGGNWRGLTTETLKFFHCGFFSQWGKEKTPRVIIPASNTTFLARLAVPIESLPVNIQKTVKIKQHSGAKTLFNANALESDKSILVVEGYIDAMSIWQATNGDIPVVALGGADSGKVLLDELTKRSEEKNSIKPQFILLLDSDETGKKSAKNLCDELIQASCPTISTFLSETDSKIDANDILQKNPAELQKMICDIYQSAEISLKEVAEKMYRNKISDVVKSDCSKNHNDFTNSDTSILSARVGQVNERTDIFMSTDTTVTSATVISDAPPMHRPEKKVKEGFYTADEVAEILGVNKSTVTRWRQKNIFGEDILDHKGVYWYSKERVEQLKEVYHKDWKNIYKNNVRDMSADEFANSSSGQNVKDSLEEKILDWQKHNGAINPHTLQEIHNAKKFLQNLAAADFTISTVTDNKNIRSVALCKFYDFLADYHTNFFNQFIAAKQNARDKMKLVAKNENVTSDIVSLAKFSLSDLRRTVDFQVSKIRKEHEDYKKYLAQESAQKKFEERQAFLSKLTTRTNCPDSPLELALPISFESTFSHDGITAIIKGVRKQLALTPILPTKKFINPETNLTNYEIAIRDEKGIWRRSIFDAQTIADGKKILELTDFGANFSSQESKYLSSYLMHLIGDKENRDKIPVCKMYQQTGWTDDSFTKFIYPPGDGENFIVRGGNFDFKQAFATRGSFGKWVQMFKKVKSASIVARIVIGAAASAPLIHLLNIRNLQLHLATPSGNGKSAAVKFALSIFGNPDKIKFKFDGTANSFDTMGLLFNDLPSFIDELQSANKKIRDNIDTLIYNFESGVNRSRNQKDNSLQTRKYFRGVRISTGEQTLTNEFSGEGAISRILEITHSQIFDNAFAIEIHQFVKQHFGQVGKKWIEYIIANDDKILQDYAFLESEYRKKEKNLMPNHISSITAFHTALIHLQIMLNFNYSLAKEECMADFDVLIKELPRKSLATNVRRALQTVREFISSHPRYFKVQAKDGKKFSFPDGDAYEIYGVKFNNGTVGIFPRALREILKDFPSSNAIIRGFGEHNFFESADNPKHPFQKIQRVEEKSVWLYVFTKDALEWD